MTVAGGSRICVPAWRMHRVELDMPPPESPLPALLPSSAAYVAALPLCQLRHPPSPPAALLHSLILWTRLSSAVPVSTSKTCLLISDSSGSSHLQKHPHLSWQLWRSLYAMDWKKSVSATAAAPLRVFANIADIVYSCPVLQLAGAVSVESSWRHRVEL